MTTANICEGPHFAKYSVLPVDIEINYSLFRRPTLLASPTPIYEI